MSIVSKITYGLGFLYYVPKMAIQKLNLFQKKVDKGKYDVESNHLSEEQVYDSASLGVQYDHLNVCGECRKRVVEMRKFLDSPRS